MAMQPRRWSLSQHLLLNYRYAARLVDSFLPTMLSCFAMFLIGSALIWTFHIEGGQPDLWASLYYMYFLMLAEPTFATPPHHWVVNALVIIAPLVGIMVVFDLLARFSLHVFSKKTKQREWINVVASMYSDHIVLCGLGKVGTKVFEELVMLGENVVSIERDENAVGVRLARASGHPVIVDDARDDKVLINAGIERCKALIATTDQDMVNIEVVLDARKFNKHARLIARIFEHELGKKIGAAFELDGVYSTSSVAAPFFAVSSLDPEIISSFYVDDCRFVVVQTTIKPGSWLDGCSVQRALDDFGLSIMTCTRAGEEQKRLRSSARLAAGDRIAFQCGYEEFKGFRRTHPIQNGE